MITINILIVALLILLTAFFVASEFAIVKARASRIDQLIAEGNKQAVAARRLTSNLDGFLSACQLGITITALGLGWLGEPTVQALLQPLLIKMQIAPAFSQVLSFIIAFSFITFIHVVLGELAPKTIAIHKAEELTLLVAKPLTFFYRVMYPFIWVLNGSAQIVARMMGFKAATNHELAHSEEELRIILSKSYKSGQINQSEYRYVNKIFEFDNRTAKEVMVPRMELVCLDKNAELEEILETVRSKHFTRYPVANGDKDAIIGIVNMKEFLTDCIDNHCHGKAPLLPYIKPIIKVIETIPLQNLLVKMQKERSHMAILLDEYGGTAGLVTVEDILEEIVGEIRDEFDEDEIPLIRTLAENHYLFDAKILIEEVNDLLATSLQAEDVDTLGGWLFTQKYDLKQGDILENNGYLFKVKEMEGTHILYVEVSKKEASSHISTSL
ncbi:hemolysin family protein [Bacillus chungangensis]|uniref:CBS domain containing-hemolysin-like protein n=1 Tax=Bacillus chungangensis TaxID=587633 RepID=A0ABT9WXS0_9BACI|nr:hemolysin family protein [Bacillus chungangensis]MDQ0178091.1 CBS domain containing-hemolysin-like protein [Bacillus chungangensis]